MKTVHVRMTEPVRLRTTDAPSSLMSGRVPPNDDDDSDPRLSDLAGMLAPADMAVIKSMLKRYPAGGSMGANATVPVTDAARAAAAKVRAGVEHIQGIAKGYRDFWDQNARDNAASIRR